MRETNKKNKGLKKESEKSEDLVEKIEKSAWAEKEEEILKSWDENRIFEKSLEKNKYAKHFVFFDGPPFATGLPHYGSILPSVMKDVIPRYRTMKGDYVKRVWGWDCHGLPIENLIEKELGLKNKKDIEELGVGKFNSAAKASVLRYDNEWKKIIPRIGRWIDMENGYKTMDSNYTESVWWGFKELYKKGLVYKDRKVMHICPRCETTLSNSEVAEGYEDITDISVTVKFELEGEPNTFLLAWTTTPWTLPGNMALAVGEDIDYVKVAVPQPPQGLSLGRSPRRSPRTILGEMDTYIVAKERVGEVFGDKEIEVVEEMKGKVLVGKKYKPVFDYYSKDEKLINRENGWKIYAGDFVTTESGTGIVHIAPAFGEDDMKLGKKNNLPFIQHVSFGGRFKDEVSAFAGQSVKPIDDNQKTDIEIIKYLAHTGKLFSKEKIIHSYPHCWRCHTPLLNYATSSWFIKVTDIKDRMVELNKKINWVPKSIGEGRFGNWLENARDWSISRARFWGAAIPVWECEKCDEREVIGSVADVKKNVKASGNTYTVMRHGQADSNVEGILSGKKDNPHHLTAKGEKEATSRIEELKSKKIDIIISSPFMRTSETAKIVASGIGVENVIYDERLSEIKTGEFEGKSIDEYNEFFGSPEGMFVRHPKDGENVQDVKERVMGFLYDIDKKYSNKNILIVTHASPIWMLLAGVRGDTKTETLTVWGNSPEGSVGTAFIGTLDFVPLPHNENYELDLHKPYIDDVFFECKCGRKMSRVPEVFDCWVESGSMPFAQMHYPFDPSSKEEFENNFPADFIAEGIDQTRGWFYTMLTLSVGIFDKSPYENVIVNGMILAEDGKKMSKSLKNYPEPWKILNKYSADALRMYILGSPVVHAEDLRFVESGVDDVQKKVIGRVLNVLSFYKLYSDASNVNDIKSDNVLDVWIMARLSETAKEIEESLDKYELDRAVRPVGLFVDDLSTWYLRRSRSRFKGEDVQDKNMALATTRAVLIGFAKIIAPIMPFTSEHLYREIGGKNESVHLEAWPDFESDEISQTENEILNEMEEVRDTVSFGLEARAVTGHKVRQPLAQLKVKSEKLKGKSDLIVLVLDEVNVKEVVFDTTIEEDVVLDTNITESLKKEGEFRDFLRYIQDARKKSRLSPSNFIILSVSTSSEGEAFLSKFIKELKSATLAKEVVFTEKIDSGSEVKIGDMVFSINILKV